VPEPPALPSAPSQPTMRELLWVALAGLAVIFLTLWGWFRWRPARRGGAAAMTMIYTRLRSAGRRLGAPDWPGLTPMEVAAGVDLQVERLAYIGRCKNALAPVGDETQRLVALYARAIYSPEVPGAEEVDEARGIWWRLRWRLWLVRIARRRSDRF
jgi:Domain of unknown function (DUF4129)